MRAAAVFGLFILGVLQSFPAAGQTKPATTQPIHPGTLYMVGYSHLDTQWRWTYPTVIAHYIPNTLHANFRLFEKYPDFIFNWTGANRYRLMKEYYPADFAKLKQWVAKGRWFPAGSCWEESLADEPSAESMVRQVLYGNEFFRREFGIASNELMLPDTFGFPASLPTILAHCGLKGFSTQKLTWGSAVGIPFNIGKWIGPDGRWIVAVLDAGSYVASVDSDPSTSPDWTRRVETNGKRDGVYVDYRYYGVGDRGGSPTEKSVQNVERALKDNGPIKVISATAAQMFDELTPTQLAELPSYKGDLLLTQHSAGTPTSEAFQKWLNRKNELLADDAERASVAAELLGAAPYPMEKLTDAWHLILAGQFHDILAGTCLPKAIDYAWNDGFVARNELTTVRNDAVGAVSRALDTQAYGAALVVYNPLSVARQDLVEATVRFTSSAPRAVVAIGPDGHVAPAQILASRGNIARVAVLASMPSVGFAVYDLQPAVRPVKSQLSVSRHSLQNQRYRVRINADGDVVEIFDKQAKRELLSSPIRLEFLHDTPEQYPAWNVDYKDRTAPPYAYFAGPAQIRVLESGPVRVAIEVRRQAEDSAIVQTIRLAAGQAGNRVEFDTHIDWHTPASDLKAAFPLAVSNPLATYNWETGTVQRGNNDPKKYEVPSHQWFDLTDRDGSYGVSVLEDCKYASDKPDDRTLRLTLLRTPGVHESFTDQATQDFGRHHVLYALEGHAGDWRDGDTQWQAMRLNQPLTAFVAPKHDGVLGKSFSLMGLSTRQVAVRALKKAEDGDHIIVRLQELTGRPAPGITFSGPESVGQIQEVDGQERKMGPVNGSIDMPAYGLRAFSIAPWPIGAAPPIPPPVSAPLELPFDVEVITQTGEGVKLGRGFDAQGRTIPAEMLPGQMQCEGITFKFGSAHALDAVVCRGQTIALPAGKYNRLYLLAASDGEANVAFHVDDRAVKLAIQDWGGFIGQSDDRIWKGSNYPEADYEWHNRFAGVAPGFVRPDPIAWYSSHRHAADGSNEIYDYCYLFKYRIDLPDHASKLTLPDQPRVKILAATAAYNDNDAVSVPAPDWPWVGIALSNPETEKH